MVYNILISSSFFFSQDRVSRISLVLTQYIVKNEPDPDPVCHSQGLGLQVHPTMPGQYSK